ncbi:MAG: hypothetical protein M5U28_52815 [Sandaracinaceae bacterium]|nr:hypothetical protein [Sandaracinaceae bacterium]
MPELARDPSRASDFDVSVLLDLDGERRWFQLTVKPRVLRTFDASLIVAGTELQERLREHQRTLHQICALVGRAVRHDNVHLPHHLAA